MGGKGSGRKQEPEKAQLTIYVDPELRKRIKIAAIEADTSVSAWVTDAIQARLARGVRHD